MPAYRYTALDAAGQTLRGTMEAPDEATVISRLQRQGQIPMRTVAAGRSNLLHDLMTLEFGQRRGLSRRDLTSVTRELATMLGAGQDLDRALRFLVETAPNKQTRTVMERVRNKVRGGNALATALAQEPQSFSRLYVGLVRAGEAGGALGDTLDRLATLLDRQRSLVTTVQSAMIYPSLLLVAAVGSIVLLLTEVLPQFVPLFQEAGAKLPLATQLLIDVGAFITNYGLMMLVLLAVLVLVGNRALTLPSVRVVYDRIKLKAPILGGIAREVLAARFCRTLGSLLQNGVPLIGALAIVREALGNTAAVAVVDKATTSAKGGAGLSRPLAEAKLFPVRTIHLLRLGEETAQLSQMALRAAEIHEEQTRASIQRLVALLVPMITIVMGAAVAFIVGSLLTAMLNLNDLAAG